MARRKHKPEGIIRKLAEGHRLLAGGMELVDVCRRLEIAESTWHRWLSQYGGMKADDAKRLKEFESENATLKKLLAEAVLDNRDVVVSERKKMVTLGRRRQAVCLLEDEFGVCLLLVAASAQKKPEISTVDAWPNRNQGWVGCSIE